MEKLKKIQQNKKIITELKKLQDSSLYTNFLLNYLKNNKESYKNSDVIPVPVEWIQQFINDFVFWINQNKNINTLNNVPLGAVLFEHHNHAQLFLEKNGYQMNIDKEGNITIKKKKAEKKNAKKKSNK